MTWSRSVMFNDSLDNKHKITISWDEYSPNEPECSVEPLDHTRVCFTFREWHHVFKLMQALRERTRDERLALWIKTEGTSKGFIN
jgi:hypothetical protein